MGVEGRAENRENGPFSGPIVQQRPGENLSIVCRWAGYNRRVVDTHRRPFRGGPDSPNGHDGFVDRVIDGFSPGLHKVLPYAKFFGNFVFQRLRSALSTAGRLLFEEEDG